MNPGRFYLPNMSTQFGPFMRANYFPNGNGFGLLGKITNSIRRFNWSGLLNGANKTLNVVNQTIPLVRQAGPMVSNMKNMFKIAKAFGNETTSKRSRNSQNTNNLSKRNLDETTTADIEDDIQKKEVINDNYPNFFI